jgi:hypothetical protein
MGKLVKTAKLERMDRMGHALMTINLATCILTRWMIVSRLGAKVRMTWRAVNVAQIISG